MKALETPEEKRARRLAKKEAKEKKRREKMGWSEEYMGYTNADNPFGDNNLLGTFKWQKVRWEAVVSCVQSLFVVPGFWKVASHKLALTTAAHSK